MEGSPTGTSDPSLHDPQRTDSPEQHDKESEQKVKKRTKTGCHTCRTRRIKCDEGKPECNNCIKSKRHCEGYGPRSSNREGSDAKRSRRFAPYGDRESIVRTYKNIVPAPPKEPPLTGSRSPKRKRELEIEIEHPEQSESKKSVSPRRSSESTSSRFSSTPRISISSLLTVDPATIAAYISEQSLNTYAPNYYNSSPLNDEILFKAFKHYVEVVAPTMSLVESSPPNPTFLNHHFTPNLKACNLFTYQLPIMAVSGNWALMEAILAISFLHISHVTRSSKQQAFLHYELALKRLRIESQRLNAARDLGLLAAMLLLAWYELTTGDHLKWVRHMTGAKDILREFGTPRLRVTPEQKAPAEDGTTNMDLERTQKSSEGTDTGPQSLVHMRAITDRLQISTGRNLLHELFYFYGKMDVIQALVRGAAPLLDLSGWQYPLRGPSNTLLGLSDALIHLMARLAKFIEADRERKLHQSVAHAQEMRPPPQSSSIPSNPSHSSPQSSTSPSSSPWSRSQSTSSSYTDQLPTPTTTPSTALQDWDTLSTDFKNWKTAFTPLRKFRVEANMPTPFGPAIIYSDIRVAATQMLYLAAQIHLTRAHPNTPAATPAAIGMSAPQNGPLVSEIMRIQEGLWDTANFRHVGNEEDGRTVGGDGRTVDHVVSALSNSAWPMLVGGVQVRDEGQRKWMKTRLCDIYELSGFATAIRVRKGLEIAWGHRVRGEPTGFEDIDSDEETDLSLVVIQQREEERELKQRKKFVDEIKESRFVLVKEGENWLGEYGDATVAEADLTCAAGVLGAEASPV